MSELVHTNRYVHDFASALWICGTILMWMIERRPRAEGVGQETLTVLARLARQLWFITVPALVVSLASGGVRAATFARYEHPDEITASTVSILVAKHVVFAALVVWGVWVHWRSSSIAHLAAKGAAPPAPQS